MGVPSAPMAPKPDLAKPTDAGSAPPDLDATDRISRRVGQASEILAMVSPEQAGTLVNPSTLQGLSDWAERALNAYALRK